MRLSRIVLAVWFLIAISSAVGPPAVEWTRTFTGLGLTGARSVKPTSDGGYVVVGGTDSIGMNSVCYIVKTDSSGNMQWQQMVGGAQGNGASSVLQTPDGGYAIAGSGGTPQSVGVLLVKLRADGSVEWQRVLVEDGDGYDLERLDDGSFVVSAGLPGDSGTCLIKTDSLGNLVWKRRYEGFYGMGEAVNIPMRRTADGGFIVGAQTLLKTDSLGVLQWLGIYNRVGCAYSVAQTSDGGYVATGLREPSSSSRRQKVYLLRTDSAGNQLWIRDYGAPEGKGLCVEPVDGGFLIVGEVWSREDATAPPYIIRVDSTGNPVWEKMLPGIGVAASSCRAVDGGFVITGSSSGNPLFLTKLVPEQGK